MRLQCAWISCPRASAETVNPATKDPLWVKLVIVALSVFVGLVLCEAAIRLVAGSPLAQRLPVLEIRANPHRGYEMVPGQTHYMYHHEVHVNALGLRGPEVEPKRDGETRILALGDSMTYGQGVADDQTLPHYLGVVLAQRDRRGKPWTVVNAGHRAYDTRQELALLNELGERLKPDIVVLFWFWNDLYEIDIEAYYNRLLPKGRIAFDTKVRIEGWARVEWEAVELLRRSALIMFVHDAVRAVGAKPLDPTAVETGLERLARHLDRLVEIAQRSGFRPLFAVVPDPNVIVGSHQSKSIDARAERLALERGIWTVRLIEPLVTLYERTGRMPVVPYDGHYSAEANLGMAEVTADVVLRAVQGTAP